MSPALLALLPEAIALVRAILERVGGNREAARVELRRMRDHWAAYPAVQAAQRAELERALDRRATYEDLVQRAGLDDPRDERPTARETPGAKKAGQP